MTSSEDAQKDMNNRFFKVRINRIIDYADLNNLQDQVEFLENPGWTGTFQTLHEIERAIKKVTLIKFNLYKNGRAFDIDNPKYNITAKFG